MTTRKPNPFIVFILAYGPWPLTAIGLFLAAGGVS